jgi:2-polyprenyl-3-methyl-5-hydroxy-6-metoxy-1,4-benzoquinol methylase
MNVPIADYVDREAFVLEHCRGKSVLHVGCVGDRMLRDGERELHYRIADVTSELWGLDINASGMKAMKDQLSAACGKRVVGGDAEHLPEIDGLPTAFDVVLLADIVEHVGNPALVLRGARERVAPSGSILLTTPNVGGLTALLRFLRAREMWASAHTFWFSFSTLRRLCERCGLRVVRYNTAFDFMPRKGFRRLKMQLGRWFLKLAPRYGGTIVALLERDETGENCD